MAFSFEIESKKDHGVIIPNGSLLSVFDAKEMLEAVEKNLNQHVNFIIDLGKVTHISSEGLNVLLNVLTRSRNAGGETILCNLSTHLESLLIITKLSNIFTITKDKKSAVGILKKTNSK